MNFSASLPKRAENFAQPVCGTSEIWTTASSPMASRLPTGRLSMSSPMSTSRLSPESGQRSGSAMSSSMRVDISVSWFSRLTRPVLVDVCGCPPAIADEPVLDRELGGRRRLALALARADDDQLERAFAPCRARGAPPAARRARRASRAGRCSRGRMLPVVIEASRNGSQASVTLTARGRAALDAARR